MAKRPRPLTENLAAVLAAIPQDGSAIEQRDIYETLGYAAGVGAHLEALRKRGLVEQTGDQWIWRRVVPPA
jgi:uncharacterized membrane protein